MGFIRTIVFLAKLSFLASIFIIWTAFLEHYKPTGDLTFKIAYFVACLIVSAPLVWILFSKLGLEQTLAKKDDTDDFLP